MCLALVIEDEPDVAGFVVGAFRYLGLGVLAVESIEDAVELIDGAGKVAIAFVHLSRKDEQQSFVATVAARWPHIKIIVLSSRREDMRRLPPAIFVTKPTSGALLMAILKRVALDALTPRGFLH